MGLRYRKSINLGGGFRVNLSSKGIGYSWGVKGYRITKTADGRVRQTVSIPGTGISYVDESGSAARQSNKKSTPNNPLDAYDDIKTIHSTSAENLRSEEYDKLFHRMKIVKWLTIGLLVAALILVQVHDTLFWSFLIAAGIVHFAGKSRIDYDFDDIAQEQWNRIHDAWNAVASSERLYQVVLTAKNKDKRKSAGIEKAIDTVPIKRSTKLPARIKTNIDPIIFKMRDTSLAILPDRLLIIEKKKFGALRYQDIKVTISGFGFLEKAEPPKDSKVIKYVWAYANNDGSPDKRFSDNRQLPLSAYGKIDMTSSSGLNISMICSNMDAAEALADVLGINAE